MSSEFRVRYAPAAWEDLQEILEYIAQEDPKAAVGVIDRIDEAIGVLKTFPESGVYAKDRNLRRFGYRMLCIDRFIAFYTFDGRTVEIHRVVHGKRRYAHLFD